LYKSIIIKYFFVSNLYNTSVYDDIIDLLKVKDSMV